MTMTKAHPPNHTCKPCQAVQQADDWVGVMWEGGYELTDDMKEALFDLRDAMKAVGRGAEAQTRLDAYWDNRRGDNPGSAAWKSF